MATPQERIRPRLVEIVNGALPETPQALDLIEKIEALYQPELDKLSNAQKSAIIRLAEIREVREEAAKMGADAVSDIAMILRVEGLIRRQLDTAREQHDVWIEPPGNAMGRAAVIGWQSQINFCELLLSTLRERA